MSVNEKMTAIADAIREKTGETGLLSLDAMAEAILGLSNAGDAETLFASGTFTAEGLTAVNEVNHRLGRIPKVIMLFLDDTGITAPSSSTATSTIKTIYSWAKIEDGVYTYRTGRITFTRFAYYPSASATSQSYIQRQAFSTLSGTESAPSSVAIRNATETHFDCPVYLDDGKKYRWIAIA